MPSYPSNFVSGAARGTTSTNNVTERFELRIGQQTTVASAVTLTNVRVATTAALAGTYNSSDLGLEFNYYDTNSKIGFFGIELENTGAVKYFKILENATKTLEKFSGTLANLKLNQIIASSISINNNYGVTNLGESNFSSLIVNSKKYRNGISPVSNSGEINLSNNFYLIYDLQNISTINMTNGLEGEIFYVRIKNNSAYSWGNMIKWNNNIVPSQSQNGKYDVYQFVCFGANLYCGNFSFNHD